MYYFNILGIKLAQILVYKGYFKCNSSKWWGHKQFIMCGVCPSIDQTTCSLLSFRRPGAYPESHDPGRESLWIGGQSITGLSHTDTHSLTPTDNLSSSVYLSCISLDFGRKQSTQKKPTQGEHANSSQKGLLLWATVTQFGLKYPQASNNIWYTYSIVIAITKQVLHLGLNCDFDNGYL